MSWYFNNPTLDALSDNLISGWNFDPANDLDDRIGSNNGVNDGTIDIAGVNNRGRFFDGIDDKIDVAHSASIATLTGFSIFTWVNFTAIGTVQVIASKYDSNSKRSYILFARSNGAIRGVVSEDGSNALGSRSQSTTAAGAVSVGNWQLIGMTYSTADDTVRVYVDGANIGVTQQTAAASIASFSDVPLLMGASYATGVIANPYGGSYDELMFWNAVIGQPAVTALWNGGAGTFLQEEPTPVVVPSGVIQADFIRRVLGRYRRPRR